MELVLRSLCQELRSGGPVRRFRKEFRQGFRRKVRAFWGVFASTDRLRVFCSAFSSHSSVRIFTPRTRDPAAAVPISKDEREVAVKKMSDASFNFFWPIAVRRQGWHCRRLLVKDLWSGGEGVEVPVTNAMVAIPAQLGPDKTPRGGLSVLSLKPLP